MLLHSNIIGEGKPFVILHGFLGMSDNWKTLGSQFSEQGFQVHLVDQRNHGRSFHDDAFNYEMLAEDLKHYCDENKLSEIVLLGHSMGGKTAMLFASLYPEIVSKLLIADISPRFYPVHHDAILEGLSALDFEVIKSRAEADKILKNKVGEIGESLPSYTRFEKDTLFLRGDRSEYIGVDDEAIIKNHFSKSKIVTISNAGHWLHAENPKDFFEAVINFVNS